MQVRLFPHLRAIRTETRKSREGLASRNRGLPRTLSTILAVLPIAKNNQDLRMEFLFCTEIDLRNSFSLTGYLAKYSSYSYHRRLISKHIRPGVAVEAATFFMCLPE
jgi:hypothetical protein